MGKSMMSLGHLSKGASWEELIQACVQCFGKSTLAGLGSDKVEYSCTEQQQRRTC